MGWKFPFPTGKFFEPVAPKIRESSPFTYEPELPADALPEKPIVRVLLLVIPSIMPLVNANAPLTA